MNPNPFALLNHFTLPLSATYASSDIGPDNFRTSATLNSIVLRWFSPDYYCNRYLFCCLGGRMSNRDTTSRVNLYAPLRSLFAATSARKARRWSWHLGSRRAPPCVALATVARSAPRCSHPLRVALSRAAARAPGKRACVRPEILD